MAQISAFLAAVLIIGIIIIAIIVVLIAIAINSTAFKNASTLAKIPCSVAPTIPSNLVVKNPQTDILTLSWDYIADADSYIAYLGKDPNFFVNLALQNRSTTTNSISFGNLALGQTFYLKVAAINTCGVSETSAEVTFTIPFTFPSRFIIANYVTPALQVCDTHSKPAGSDTTVASAFCSFTDTWAFYQASDKSIRQIARPSNCLTRGDVTTGYSVSYLTCTGGADQAWVYDAGPGANTLCAASNPGDCLTSQGTSSTVRTLVHGGPGGQANGGWTFPPV